jgi:hypothetical protein
MEFKELKTELVDFKEGIFIVKAIITNDNQTIERLAGSRDINEAERLAIEKINDFITKSNKDKSNHNNSHSNQKKENKNDNDKLISDKQRKRLYAIAKEKNISTEKVKQILAKFGYQSSKDVKVKDYDKIIQAIQGGQ